MDYQVLSIDELVRECGERPCPEADEEFIRRFQPIIAKVGLRVLREFSQYTPDTLEDMVQNTFAKLWAQDRAVLRRFKPQHPNAFRGLLKRITANVVYDHLRSIKVIVENTDALDEDTNPIADRRPAGSVENEILFNQVNDILLKRGNGPAQQKERAIFWLYFRYGMTAKAIASIPSMNLTEEGVESAIFRLTNYVKRFIALQKREENPGGIQAAGSF